jgi:cytochrome c-type biogenesis protein CcmH/NrfG
MRYLILIVVMFSLLLVLAGAVAGYGLFSAHQAKEQARLERVEMAKTVAELKHSLEELRERAEQVERTREEALEAWHLRSLSQLALAPTHQTPPQAYRGLGGGQRISHVHHP